jgi:inhibitor of KinA
MWTSDNRGYYRRIKRRPRLSDVHTFTLAKNRRYSSRLAPELTLPRRAVPRAPAPAGSLLIAGGQALIASCVMPTGWYGIGRTPVKTFDPSRTPAFLANIGDEICFERIDPAAFDAFCRQAEAGDLIARAEFLDEA